MSEQAQNTDGTQSMEVGVQIITPSALEALQRAEVDIAIATAKKYPRDIATAIKTCRELALRNPKIAGTCNYAVPRAGRKLVGPSVHFARIVMYAWGNCTALARVVGADRGNAHLQGVFHDLQTNARVGIEMDWPVQPPHVDSPERWLDQINLAKRAGSAVALRTAIFNVIPMVLFEDIAEDAKRIALGGGGKTFGEQRASAIAAAKERGITQPMLYHALGVGGLESITTDDLIWLHAALQSIKDGTMTVAEIFGKEKDAPIRAREPKRGEHGRFAQEPPAPAPSSEPPREPEPPPPTGRKAPARKAAEPPAAPPSAQTPPEDDLPLLEDTAARLLTRLHEEQVPVPEFLGWLKSMGVAPLSATDLGPVPPHVLDDALAHWGDNLAAYLDWQQRRQNEPAKA